MSLINKVILLALPFIAGCAAESVSARSVIPVPESHVTPGTQWQGKKVGVLGDSMSQPRDTTQSKRFYNYLADLMGIEPYVYAVSGYQMKQMLGEAERMHADHPEGLDAILIWAGTNDYNSSIPVGEFFTEEPAEVNVNGVMSRRMHRTHVMSDSTFCGRINMLLSTLKDRYPETQIVILTPIHRGPARFSGKNIQPPEDYANATGAYLDDYVSALRRGGEIWSVPVIDLFSISGLYPASRGYDDYIQRVDTDRLHPSDLGHYRLARTLQFQLMALPPDWR